MQNTYATSWDRILQQHAQLMDIDTARILQAQSQVFQLGIAPNIVHPDVKIIPIQECDEPCVDIQVMNHPCISMMPNPVQPYASMDFNAGFDCSSLIRATLYQSLLKMIDELDRLAPHFGYEKGQLEIKVFEGLRTVQVQEALFNTMYETVQKEFPHFAHEQLYLETCKYVSPVQNNIPVHSTGAAIDMRLWDNKNNRYIDTGLFVPNPQHDTELYGVLKEEMVNVGMFSPDITDQQKLHRLLLCIAALNSGFTSYIYEFWHFSVGDRYAAYWREQDITKRVAVFGSVIQ